MINPSVSAFQMFITTFTNCCCNADEEKMLPIPKPTRSMSFSFTSTHRLFWTNQNFLEYLPKYFATISGSGVGVFWRLCSEVQ